MNMARLLIIEDNAIDLAVLERKLSGMFSLTTATTLSEARRVIANEELDAVLLDLGLPDSDRERTMRECKRICPPIAIVVLSGNPDPELIRRTISENASDYLVKGVGDSTGVALANSINTAIKSNTAICELRSMSPKQ